MATKKSKTKSGSGSRTSRRKRKTIQPMQEPVPARALQSIMFLLGILLLLGALVGLQWGLSLLGVLIFASALPPLRPTIDRWLVGTTKGDEANQAAMFRMAAGVIVILFALIVLR